MTFALALLATSAHAGSKPKEAFYVRCDTSTMTSTSTFDPGGISLMFQPTLDPTGGSGVTVARDRAGDLVATVHGSPFTADAIIGIDPNGQALVGIEPDEIDYFPGSDPLEGIEPDEIDVAVFLCASDCASASQSWPAYAIADLTVDPTGATVLTPVQIVVNTNAF
ncbi:MAG: hypothetical protein H6735_00615 [Alphaproteobacteria bacterium]|nr:hypothetical protein [Alphaproteobacteria bacterium]